MPEFKNKEEYEKWKTERIKNLKENPDEMKQLLRVKAKGKKHIANFKVGTYVVGLSLNGPIKNITCLVDENNLVFIDKSIIAGDTEAGYIRRDAINSIDIIDKTAKRHETINPLGLLVGGKIGLMSAMAGRDVKEKEFRVVIDWHNPKGLKCSAEFAFQGENSDRDANEAANNLKKFIKEKAFIMKNDERKCPFCAEVIKKEAKICRFCNREL